MFSSTLKRSAATLGVVAGVLAAAGPAGADSVDPIPTESISFVKRPVAGTQGRDFGDSGYAFLRSEAPSADTYLGAEVKRDV
jgi:hypothetical protein